MRGGARAGRRRRKGAVLQLLVTGGSGFVGRAVVNELLAAGHQVTATFATTAPAEGRPGLTWSRWNAAENRLPEVDWNRLSGVIHLALPRRLAPFPECAAELYEVATASTFRLLERAQATGVGRFVLASTGDVLADAGGAALESSDRYGPPGFYGAAKAAAELLARSFEGVLPVCVARIYHPYGPGGERFLINRLVARVAVGQEVTVEGPEGILLNPVWLEDLAIGFRQAVEATDTGVFHFGGPELITLRECLELAGQVNGTPARIRHLDATPVERHAGDCSRAAAVLGYRPRVGIREGILRLLAPPGVETGG